MYSRIFGPNVGSINFYESSHISAPKLLQTNGDDFLTLAAAEKQKEQPHKYRDHLVASLPLERLPETDKGLRRTRRPKADLAHPKILIYFYEDSVE